MYKFILPFLLLITVNYRAQADHAAGIELYYSQVPGAANYYNVTVRFYRDCGQTPQTTAQEPPTFYVCFSSSCTGIIQNVTLSKLYTIGTNPPSPNGSIIYNGCDTATTCTNLNSVTRGYRQWWYKGIVYLSTPCTDWKFWTTLCCRSEFSGNIGPNLPETYDLYAECTFDNTVSILNSSPTFNYENTLTKNPVPHVFVGMPYLHNGGAIDPDNDSIVFETIYPRSQFWICNSGSPIPLLYPSTTYNILNTNGNPLPTNNTYMLSQNNGHFSFTPSQTGYWTLAHKISEYRNGSLIGSTMREIQVVAEGPGGSSNITTYVNEICKGTNFTVGSITLPNVQTDTLVIQIFTSINGCDSLIYNYINVIDINNTISISGSTFTSNEPPLAGVDYQWYTCNPFNPIIGATNPSYTASSLAPLAVVVTKNGCSDTSVCQMATTIANFSSSPFRIFPNPAQDELFFSVDLTSPVEKIIVFNSIGEIIYENPFPSTYQKVSLKEWKPGFYYVKYLNRVEKLIVQ